METLEFARQDQAGLCYDLIQDGRAFQEEQGILQWTDSYPSRDTVRQDIQERKGCLLLVDGAPAGYLCLDFGGEPAYRELRGEWLTREPYAVIHRMALGRAFRGRGLAGTAFRLAEELCRQRGVFTLRVDTDASNLRMQHVLAQSGFRHSGLVLFQGGDKLAYEKPLSPAVRLPRRPRAAHKGDFGKLMILAGSVGYTGAPVLAARAALRTGAGLVYLGVPREIYPIVAGNCLEAMPFPLPPAYGEILDRFLSCDVALIGPGLGREPETEALVLRLLAELKIPVVLDADGINAVAGHIDILDKRQAPTVLTPHEGEFGRLAGCTIPVRDRLAAALEFSRAHRCTLVLKGHGTVTAAPDGRAWVNSTGGPGMAKGGSGDVLAGMIAALWGQRRLLCGGDLPQLCAWAAYLHGAAGDLCAEELGEYAMTPGDLIEALPRMLK